MEYLKCKRVLITGACGTVGSALVKLLSEIKENKPMEIIGVDNNESEIFFQDQKYDSYDYVNFQYVDIRNRYAVSRMLEDVDIVFHAAALKHVILSERSPNQVVETNITGLQNMIDGALERNVERFVFTSSDKAVNPTNVMGTSKLMGERLVTAANNMNRSRVTKFASTRFGNVLGSNGSVYKIFRNQIENNMPLTITDYKMTRFVMSVDESAMLVLKSAELMVGGEVFITKMPVVKISDLGEAMHKMHNEKTEDEQELKFCEIGVKAGEKLYEELMSEEEISRSVELDNFFVVLPAFRSLYNQLDYQYVNTVSKTVRNPYNSSLTDSMKVGEIVGLLHRYKLGF